jgi:hypothetical protein
MPGIPGGGMPGMPGGMTPPDLSKPEEADPNEVAPEPEPGCEELPVDESQKKNWSGKVNPTLMAGQFPAGGEAVFDDYYTKYLLPQWTQWKNVGKLPDLRGQLRSSHLGKHTNGTQVHDHLAALVLDFMSKLAAGPYYRAVRLNAMLMIGELNSIETPPVPLPEALKVLVATVDSDKAPDAVRAAAMVGVLRHAGASNLDDEGRRLITTAMLRLVAAGPPVGAAAPGRQWILAQGLRTLGVLGSPGEGGAVAKGVLAAVAEPKFPLCVRCVAADSMGRLKYSDAAAIEPLDAAPMLARLATDACIEEIRLLKPDSIAVERGRLKRRLDVVLAAVATIAALAKEPPQQAWFAEFGGKTLVKGLSDMLDDPKFKEKDKEVKAAVEGLPKKIDAWLEKKPK